MAEVRRFKSSVLDAHSRGVEFGAAHPGQVRASVAAYEELFKVRGEEQGKSASEVAELAFEVGLAALAQVDAWAPELGQELRGIAAGAGLALEAVAALNARTEVFAAIGYGAGVRGECSTVVALGADDQDPVGMQNWDWFCAFEDRWLVWEIPFADGGVTTTVTEYGIVGKLGFGARGLGVLFNILTHELDGRLQARERDGRAVTAELDGRGGEAGVPVHVLARNVMDRAASVDEAVALMRSATTSASSVLTLVNDRAAGKQALCAEMWPGGVDLVQPQDGLLCHTNHFLGEHAGAGDTYLSNKADTLARLAALRRRLGAVGGSAAGAAGGSAIGSVGGNADAEQLRGALGDHSGSPYSVCCHPDPQAPETGRYGTLVTARLNFAERTLDVTAGNPCGRAA